MAAVRALQASRTFSRVVLPVHSRAFSRIATRAPQALARVGPSSVRTFSVTSRVQDGKYNPLPLFERVLSIAAAFSNFFSGWSFSSERLPVFLSIQRPQTY